MAGIKRTAGEVEILSQKKRRQNGNTPLCSTVSTTPSIFTDETASIADTTFSTRSSSQRPKNYICEYDGCGKAFDRPVRLEAHIRTHTNERPFVCQEVGCDKAFFKSEHLKAHIRDKHTETADHLCNYVLHTNADGEEQICNMAFTTASRLKRHLALHEKKEDLKCDYCGQTFRKMETLQRHIKQDHLNEKAFVCSQTILKTTADGEEIEDECGRAFATVSQLKTHVKREHAGSRYYCEICYPPRLKLGTPGDVDAAAAEVDRPGFKTWADLQAHIKLYHPPTCSTCGKVCRSNRDLTAHIDIEHNSERQDFPCTHLGCDRSFSKKGNLAVHLQTVHAKIKRFVCGESDLSDASSKGKIPGWTNEMGCGVGFTTKASLESHVVTQHLDLPALRKKPNKGKKIKGEDVEMVDSPMEIESTSGRVQNSGAPLGHLTGHAYADDRPLACSSPGCNVRFTRQFDLEQHLRAAHGLDGFEQGFEHSAMTPVDADRFWLGGYDETVIEDEMFGLPAPNYDMNLANSFGMGRTLWGPPNAHEGESMLLDPALLQ